MDIHIPLWLVYILGGILGVVILILVFFGILFLKACGGPWYNG
jgi:hypothetical protein